MLSQSGLMRLQTSKPPIWLAVEQVPSRFLYSLRFPLAVPTWRAVFRSNGITRLPAAPAAAEDQVHVHVSTF